MLTQRLGIINIIATYLSNGIVPGICDKTFQILH